MTRPRALSSFTFLNVTQFLGATNDNLFKMAVIFMLIGVMGDAESATILAVVGGVFVVPFLLFSIPAGTLADRFSKRDITVITKVLEVIAMLLGVLAFTMTSVWGVYAVLFLMAFQSALFGPSKYGILPELVRREEIARANGILTGLTVLAAIVGTFFGSYLTDLTHRNFVVLGWICVGIGVIGLLASICIERTPALGIKRNLSLRMVTGVVSVLRRARKENYLLASLIGSSYFFLVGAFVQLSIIPFGIQSLGLTDVESGYLFVTAAIGIAFGAFIAGRVSGKKVELGISVLAGLGVSSFFLLLYFFQYSLVFVVTALAALGIFGGMFLVPFDSYIQAASPNEERGENVAAGNFLSFVGVAIAAFLVYFFGDIVHITAAASFAWMSLVTFFLAIGLAYRMSDTFVRLLARLNFHADKHIEIVGEDLVSHHEPSCFLTHTIHWEIGMLTMIALQVRYMRFLMEQPKGPLSRRDRLLTYFAKVAFYDGEAPKKGSEAYVLAERALARGYSLTVIPARERTDLSAIEKTCHTLAGDYKVLYADIDETAPAARGHLTPDMRVTIKRKAR